MARCPLWSPGRDAGEEATPERPELLAFPEELTHWHHFCHSFIGVSLTPNKLHHTSDNEQLLTPKVPSDTFKALSQAPAASARSLGNRDTFSGSCVFSGVSRRRNHTPSPFSVCPAPFPEHGHAAAVRSAAHVSCTALSIHAVPFVCPVTCGWTRTLLPFLAATNKAAMTIHVPKTTLMLVNILTFW